MLAYACHADTSAAFAIYEKLGKDENISFCYPSDPAMDYPDEVIIDNWLKNKENELNP